MENLFIGLMSGTSVDSIDSALVNIDTGSFELLESSSSSIKKNLKKRIDGGRFYIRPHEKELFKNHPWNFLRDVSLPIISEFKIQKIRMPENYSFYFELNFLKDMI